MNGATLTTENLAQSLSLDLACGSISFPTDALDTMIVYTGTRAIQLGATDAPLVSTFLQLNDTPSTFGGSPNAGRAMVINEAGDGLVVGDVSTVSEFSDLSDAPPVSAANQGQVWGVDSLGNWGLITVSMGSTTFSGLTDTLTLDAKLANQMLVINGTGTGVISTARPVHSFFGLDDTPSSVTPADGGKVWRVNLAGTGMELGIPDTAFRPRGAWDASPGTAPSATPEEGDFYTVSVAGTFNSVAYGTDDAIYYASGQWFKIEGGQGAVGTSTVTGADDTLPGPPLFGQGLVWMEDGLSVGNDGFIYQDFVRTALTSNAYLVNRLLVSDGTNYVDVEGVPAPIGSSEGQLGWWDTENGRWSLLNRGGDMDVLTGAVSGSPVYKSFQTLLNASTVPDNSLAQQNQAVLSDRQVSLNGFTLDVFAAPGVGRRTSILWDTGNDSLVMGAQNGLDATSIRLTPTGTELRFVGDADLKLWDTTANGGTGVYQSGSEGQAVVSQGPGVEPHWSWPRMVTQSPDGTYWELTVDDEGTVNAGPLVAVEPPAPIP